MSYRKKHTSSQQEQAVDLSKLKYNNPGTLRTLSTSQLTSGLPYQRPVKQEKVDRIIREWNPRKITPIIVSFRDGSFNIVDGQHHAEAARQRAGGRDVDVPCIIHTGMTYQEEAQMYADLDTDKTPLTPRQHTKALVEAGSDPKIMDIQRLVEEGGFTWALDIQTGVPYGFGQLPHSHQCLPAFRQRRLFSYAGAVGRSMAGDAPFAPVCYDFRHGAVSQNLRAGVGRPVFH